MGLPFQCNIWNLGLGVVALYLSMHKHVKTSKKILFFLPESSKMSRTGQVVSKLWSKIWYFQRFVKPFFVCMLRTIYNERVTRTISGFFLQICSGSVAGVKNIVRNSAFRSHIMVFIAFLFLINQLYHIVYMSAVTKF